MGKYITRIKTTFNDGSGFEGNEIQRALVVGFTAKDRGGVRLTEILGETESCDTCQGRGTLCETNEKGYVIYEETCPVCGDPEPCSHDFDKENRELEAIARRMGTKNGPIYNVPTPTKENR